MTENMKKLLELTSENEELKDKLSNVSRKEVIALAKEYGIELTDADFAAQTGGEELSDDELDAVAGGKECSCLLGGGGTGEDKTWTLTCACVGGGGGEMNTKYYTGNNKARCACVAAGYGGDHPLNNDL